MSITIAKEDGSRLRNGLLITMVGIAVVGRPTVALAQQEDRWVGKRVMQRYPGLQLRTEDRVVDATPSGPIYRVEEIDGARLRVRGEGRGLNGWVEAHQVIPLEQAIEFFTGQIRSHPTDPHGYVMRATALRVHKHALDAAVRDFNEAVRLAPMNPSVYIHRGFAFEEAKDYESAIADFNEAIRLEPTNATAYANRGCIWGIRREDDKALADFNEAIRLEPARATAYYNRGAIWGRKKEFEKALADFNEAVRLNPADAKLHNNRGAVWSMLKEYDKARADFNEAIRLDPTDSTAYSNRGYLWAQGKDYARAMADYIEATRLDPQNAPALSKRAWLLATCPDAKFRDGMRAVELAVRACELANWKNALDVETLAAAYAETGNFVDAAIWQVQANSMSSSANAKQRGEMRLKLYRENKPYRTP
jgi:tetratricopeptide (TPR) repeat protein